MTIHHRDDLDAVQRELAAVPATSVLIYDQTCASEKRRRRKRGSFADPDKRVIINDLVCEGCGDCSVKSNCVSVQPLETEFGRKRRIDQSSCNKDFSCVKGFCPSFVTVHGRSRRRWRAAPCPRPRCRRRASGADPPDDRQDLQRARHGVGGTGVITVGQIMGMAAHLEGKGLGLIDMAGLARRAAR
jgi:indolepyruvate ferredoxin oxidoreductase